MSRWTVDYRVRVHLVVEDESALTRVEEADWQETFYAFASGQERHGAVEMLARCLAMERVRLGDMDGWADMPDRAARAAMEIDLVEVRQEGGTR